MSVDLEHLLEEVSRGFASIERQYGSRPGSDGPQLKLISCDPEQAQSSTVAAINDRFRTAEDGNSGVPGFQFLSPVLTKLDVACRNEIEALVRQFNDFDPNDTTHDRGAIMHPRVGEIIWQIDCYEDESCEVVADHPEDVTRSFRVLAMFCDEEAPKA